MMPDVIQYLILQIWKLLLILSTNVEVIQKASLRNSTQQLSVFKNTLSLGVHLIENTQEFFTFTTSNPACAIESIKIYTDEEGLNEFDIGTSSAIDGNYKIGISLTSPFKMQTLYIVAKTHSGKTAFKKMELNICPNTMDTDREASYFPILETG